MNLKTLLFSTIVLLLSATAGLAQTVTVAGDVCCDNTFAIYSGNKRGDEASITLHGGGNFPSGGSLNFTTDAEFLYIAAWSDDGVQQGLLHNLTLDGVAHPCDDPRWTVFRTGYDYNSNYPIVPSTARMSEYIVKANERLGWVLPTVGGPNDGTFPPSNPWPVQAGVPTNVCWVWYDSIRQVGSEAPFSAGFDHDEFLIFRLSLRETIFVPTDSPTIQGAINSASHTGTIVVFPGSYVENINFMGKAVTVKSLEGPGGTIIDGNGAGPVVTFNTSEKSDSILEGFTITNGDGGANGGGIACWSTSPMICNNIITDNKAHLTGGYGGGIYCNAASPFILNNIIADNEVAYGGGLFCFQGAPVVANNIFTKNYATWDGGGYLMGTNVDTTTYNNTIVQNDAGRWGGGVRYTGASHTIRNTILWDNGAPTGPEISLDGGSHLDIGFSDAAGGQGAVHLDGGSTLTWDTSTMLSVDPGFVEPGMTPLGDFHLTAVSPCLDGGDSAIANLPFPDFEDDFRNAPQSIGVDMGADEFYYHFYLSGDHLYHKGHCHVAMGDSLQVRIAGDVGDTVRAVRGGPTLPLPTTSYVMGGLRIGGPLLTFVGSIPTTGVLFISYTWPWSTPGDYPFQMLVGPLVPSSMLTNLMVLTVP